MGDLPIVKPPKNETKFELRQSRFPMAPRLSTRVLALGPTGQGKSVAASWMLLNMYKTDSKPLSKENSCFSRYYLWSPNALSDPTWKGLRRFVKETLKVDEEKNPFASQISERKT